ncbi:MAG: hypothetical protein AAGA85_02205 [Bacteroidota bacterium]
MPSLTNRVSSLQSTGASLEVIIVPAKEVTDKIKEEGGPVPSTRAIALIDTGASNSCVSQRIVDELALIPFDFQQVYTANGSTEQLLYDVGFILPISQAVPIWVQAPGADLIGQPYGALIGRDVLASCTMFYNGPDNSFTLQL